MNKIGCSFAAIVNLHGLDAAYKMAADTGFDCMDVSFGKLLPYPQLKEKIFPEHLTEAELVEHYVAYSAAAKKYGVENYQGHAPFPIMLGDKEFDRKMQEIMPWVLHAADAADCRRLVIHPVRGFRDFRPNRQEEYEKNMEFFSALIPAAKQYGITICLENMTSALKCGKITHKMAGVLANPTTACKYVDDLNTFAGEEIFGFCLDVGHMLLSGNDICDAMEELGHRLKCLHIHDNTGNSDDHFAPYQGIGDWERFVRGLVLSGYDGALNFEINGIWSRFPEDLYPTVLKYTAECGRSFIRHAEELRCSL